MNDREWLAAIVDATDDAIMSATLSDGLIASWNDGAQRLFGYTAAEAVGKPIAMLAPEDSYFQIAQTLGRLRSGVAVPPYEAIRLRKDGTPLNVSITLAPMRDPAGEVVGAGAIIRDISERMRVRQALEDVRDGLARQMETLELVDRATNDLVWDHDLVTGRVVRGHGIVAYGYTVDEVAPDHAWWASRVHPDDAPRAEATIASAVTAGDAVWSVQYRLRRKDGTYATVLDRALIVRDTAGRAVRMVGSVMDLTERERAQELARRGVAASELLARASHELRTPLNAILGFAELLEQRLDPSLGPRERRYLQNIRGSGDHLLQLIDRLLQIAKADSGRLELQPSVIALFGLVAPVYAKFAGRAAEAQVALDLELPDASIRVDLDRMTVVLGELVANALAATPAGGSVIVRAAIPDDDLVLEVIDSGRGIPAEARDHIFEVFRRVHEDADPSRTGLGLALSRELVELHGGTLSFQSEPGRGTTFRVHLPHVAWRREKGDRVLVVDDEPNDADFAMTVAKDAGLRAEVVGTVADARAAIIRDTPTAIVLDLRLPDGTGGEILEALRALAPTAPVLVLSAYDDEVASPIGVLRMRKPIDPAALAAWLLKVTEPKVEV